MGNKTSFKYNLIYCDHALILKYIFTSIKYITNFSYSSCEGRFPPSPKCTHEKRNTPI